MTKCLADNDKNVSTIIVAARFEQNKGATEFSGEKVWKKFGYFNNQKPDYNMEKLHITRITLI